MASKTAIAIRQIEQALESRFPSHLPICIRLDGVAFKSLTRNLQRPFDMRFSLAMINTAKELLQYFKASFAFTQSDEITLILPPATIDDSNDIISSDPMYTGLRELMRARGNKKSTGTHPYQGRQCKLISIASSIASSSFMSYSIESGLWNDLGQRRNCAFDAKSFPLNSAEEVVELLRWRQLDGQRNVINRLGQTFYGHKSIQNIQTRELVALLQREHSITVFDNANDDGDDDNLFIERQEKKFLNSKIIYGTLLKRELYDAPVDKSKLPTGIAEKQPDTAKRSRIIAKSIPFPKDNFAELIFSRYWRQ